MDIVIVTGASRGLGLALAQAYAGQPTTVVIAMARSQPPALPKAVRFGAVDLADPAQVEAAAQVIADAFAESRFGRAVLVNNAGVVGPVGALGRADPTQFMRSLQVNLSAPIVLMQAFIAASRGRADVRRVINISSGAGRRPIAGWAAYCTGKAGLDMASRVAALEAEQSNDGLTVTSLAPGVIDTGMQGEVRAVSVEDFPDVEQFRAMKASGALKSPQEVAARIVELEIGGKLPGGLADIREL